MPDVSGDFEIHLTVYEHDADRLAAFAGEHGLKFLQIELDRGVSAFQPMLTLAGRGTLAEQRFLARHWRQQLFAANLPTIRTKIEAAPWCTGIPQTDDEAAGEPDGRYFEHHLKLRLPTDSLAELLTVTDLVEPYGARLSRNARRRDPDGAHQRFVNQRCHRVGAHTAQLRLDALVDSLRAAGHEIVSVEQEYVVEDSDLELDRGWLDPVPDWHEDDRRDGPAARAGARDYPPTYQPLPAGPAISRSEAFDPALKQWPNAFRAGEPVFESHGAERRWQAARKRALLHILAVIARSEWAGHLVLRGSVTMAAWVGDAAREPGDLDFVVTPESIVSTGMRADRLLAGIEAAVAASPGAGLRPAATTHSAIWTYERADGRRLVMPFRVDDTEGTVQLDFVFGETLPIAPEVVVLPGVDRPVRAATPALSLAWKLLWLATDSYPQGKDLYDAVLLAEYTTVDLDLVRDLLRPELRGTADDFTAASVLRWDVDWPNFTAEYPAITGTAEKWQRRLAIALDRHWSLTGARPAPPSGATG